MHPNRMTGCQSSLTLIRCAQRMHFGDERSPLQHGLSLNCPVARRLNLTERRYAHYGAGRNEPDSALLIKIAEILEIA